jgi:hypothetical protein
MIEKYFSFSFSSKSTVVTNISCICNCKPLSNYLCDYTSFLPGATKDVCIYVAKMVDLDTSCKDINWNG